MVRILITLLALMTLISCAKPPGFRADDYDYTTAEKLADDSGKKTADDKTENHEEVKYQLGEVKRNSHQVQLKPMKTEWENGQLKMTAEVNVKGKSFGTVQFQGKQKGAKIVLKPTDPSLKDLRAQIRCSSAEGSCVPLYIDVLYRESKDTLLHDQVLATPKQAQPAPPKPKQNQNPNSPQNPKNPNPAPTPLPAPAMKDEADEFIDHDKLNSTGFMGGTTEEFWMTFDVEPPKKSEPLKPLPPKEEEPPVTPAPAPEPTPAPTPQPSTPAPAPAPTPTTPKPAPIPNPAPQPTPKPPVITPPIKDNSGTKSGGGKNPTIMDVIEQYNRPDMAENWPATYQGVSGSLNQGIDFRQVFTVHPEVGFKVATDTSHNFGSYGLLKVVTLMGQYLKDIIPGRLLRLTSMTLRNGGVSPLHTSHQNGVDGDVSFLRNSETSDPDIVIGGHVSSNFLVKEQWLLTKKAFASGKIDKMFMDQVVKNALCDYAVSAGEFHQGDTTSAAAGIFKNILHIPGHENHFHIRVLCVQEDSACRNYPYKPLAVNCWIPKP